MSKFDEVLASIKENDAELADQLSEAYLRDLESRDEKIIGLETKINDQSAKISEYAQENYDLMRAQPPAGGQDDDEDQKPTPRLATLDDVEAYWRNK